MKLSGDAVERLGPSPAMAGDARLRVELLGRLHITCTSGHGEEPVAVETPARRAQELLCYLLLGGRRPHHREVLAERLWGTDGADGASRGRKYLRQTLWELHRAFAPPGSSAWPLRVDAEWIGIRWDSDISSDVDDLELAYELVRRSSAARLTDDVAERAHAAAELYQGDLLEGWYQDWCVIERERCRALYFMLLDRLMAHEDEAGNYSRALRYGATLLRSEPAHERTHRRMMRLHYCLGDRTAALRQFQSCRRILREELQAAPAASTVVLYQRIHADQPLDFWPPEPREQPGTDWDAPAPARPTGGGPDPLTATLREMCALLEEARAVLERHLLRLAPPEEQVIGQSPRTHGCCDMCSTRERSRQNLC
jgi:DNA-binding SARP family transcriptional activator